MSSKIAEIVSEKVRVLPPEQQREVLDFVEQLAKSTVSAKSTRGIWEEVEEISTRVPDEAWHDVPSDGSQQHDHYLYGAPKKNSLHGTL
ncbi:MAG: hypothetical protein ABI882_20315 [Acidobacteriota bacterium]